MPTTTKIGILREGKNPPDSRVPLTPSQCKTLINEYGIDIKVAPSLKRCFDDEAYRSAGINLDRHLLDRDILMGVKEVPISQLIPDKTYLFFSHTIKKQSYNLPLLKALLAKRIWMIDYETLKDSKNERLIAFGVFAGMVGAHNGIMTYANRTKKFDLPRMNSFIDYASAKEYYKTLKLPNFRTVVTGTGRVGSGAAQVLDDMGIRKVDPLDFIIEVYDEPVYTQLACEDYVAPKFGGDYNKKDFYANPESYKSIFQPYTQKADVMINGIYWDNKAPTFFDAEEMSYSDFRIRVIADVTCDIAPISSIPSTLFASTIADPIFGYDPWTMKATEPHGQGIIDMMTIDNLPNELPRDASNAFGEMFIQSIVKELIDKDNSEMIAKATVTKDGQIGEHFGYLKEWVENS